MSKTITVEITFDDPNEPDAFKGFHPLDARAIWSALQRAFPFSMGGAWTVREIVVGSNPCLFGDVVGGR